MTAIRIIDDHLELANIGSNTHAQIEGHIQGIGSYTLPAADGLSSQVLQTDGAGVLSWVDSFGCTNLAGCSLTNLGTRSHSDLTGLGVDGHTQYVLADSTRDIVKDQNDITNLVVDNGTNGTAAKAAFRAQSDGGSVSLSALSAGHLTSSQYKTDSALLEADAGLIGGLHLSAAGASEVGFWTNGTRRGSIWLDGKWKIGVGIPTEVLDVDGNIAVSGTVDGVDIAALDTAVDGLTDNSIVDTLHRHSELVASDGSPDPALSCDATGQVGIGTATPGEPFVVKKSGNTIFTWYKTIAQFKSDNGTQAVSIQGLGAANVASLLIGNSSNKKMALIAGSGGSAFEYDNAGYFAVMSNSNANVGSGVGFVNQFKVNGSAPVNSLHIDSSGNVGFGIAAPATSAKIDITSTTGALLLSRMTTTQKNALTAVNGMLVYDSTLNKFQGYENGSWTSLI